MTKATHKVSRFASAKSSGIAPVSLFPRRILSNTAMAQKQRFDETQNKKLSTFAKGHISRDSYVNVRHFAQDQLSETTEPKKKKKLLNVLYCTSVKHCGL